MQSAYESDDLSRELMVHSRLTELLADAEREFLRLEEGRVERSLRRRAARKKREISRALAWSTKLVEKKKNPTTIWATLWGVVAAVLSHMSMFSDDNSSWDRRLTIAVFLLVLTHGYLNAWMERSSYERLLPRILVGMGGGISDWLADQALEPE